MGLQAGNYTLREGKTHSGVKSGQTVKLTEAQATAFADKFQPVGGGGLIPATMTTAVTGPVGTDAVGGSVSQGDLERAEKLVPATPAPPAPKPAGTGAGVQTATAPKPGKTEIPGTIDSADRG